VAQPARSLPRAAQIPASGSESAPRTKSAAREYTEALLIALGLALFIRTFFIQAYKIPSGSMEPTLLIGDHILVNKFIYGIRMPDSILGWQPLDGAMPWGRYLFNLGGVDRGNIVVFVFPPDRTKDFIKRVVGVPGDSVQIKDGMVWLNGAKIPDPHAHFEVPSSARSPASLRDNAGPFKVPDGKLFMMGDNRDRSFDSRFWGFIDRNDVEGRAIVIYWSWDSDSPTLLGHLRWDRLGGIVK
jgi:signal peptidase I